MWKFLAFRLMKKFGRLPFTSKLLLSVTLVTLSVNASYGAIATNFTRSGRDSGATWLYWVENESLLVRGLCRSQFQLAPSQLNCSHQRESVGLDPFFDYFSPGFRQNLGVLLAQYRGAYFGSAFLSSLLSRLPQATGSRREQAGILENILGTQTERRGELERILTGIDRANRPLIDLLIKLKDDVVHPLLAGESVHPSLRPFARFFDTALKAAVHARGDRCKRESVRFETRDGGCRDSQTGLVWSESVTGIDSFDYQFWTSRGGALRYCSQSTLGNQVGWRLATVEEIQAISGATSSYFEIVPSAYYWTINRSTSELIDRAVRTRNYTQSLGTETVVIGTQYDVAGFSILGDTHRYPAVRQLERFREVSEVMRAQFQYQVETEKLVRPVDGDVFEIRRHSLIARRGELETRHQDFGTRPAEVQYVGRFQHPVMIGTISVPQGAGRTTTEVDPLSYSYFEAPRDRTRLQIGLMCVRNGNQ